MKIFISWSGDYSHRVALALKDWLPYVFGNLSTFVSSEDIRKGKRWFSDVSKELNSSNFGIVCLTHENRSAPWILFEAGALSKLKSAQVCTLLCGNLRDADIEGPLTHFQNTQLSKSDFLKLLKSINAKRGKDRLDNERLRTIYDKWWPDLEKAIGRLPKAEHQATPPARDPVDLLYEVLEILRYIARYLPETSDRKLRDDAVLNTPVTTLGFSEKASKVLNNANILTVGSLASKSVAELRKYVGVDRKVIEEIQHALDQFGLDLAESF